MVIKKKKKIDDVNIILIYLYGGIVVGRYVVYYIFVFKVVFMELGMGLFGRGLMFSNIK